MPTSNNLAIRAERVSKVYRLYDDGRQRLLDLFGLLRAGHGYREHQALDVVSLDIRRGEKVAIIGRNGAGKSTFMKLVSGVIQPTSGRLEVSGHLHALLQIGTGFHGDFTGRENVLAYLAQTGVPDARAVRLVDEITEFAELDEYIDQPVKTYSTGMAVRLMFSTSTAIEPDVLLLDEVLGVGDAYFTQKSFDRINDLCRSSGTTLLLVTHDLYSALRLCERIVWIDRGRVLMDGDGAAVVRAYESSIRMQEEQRLRQRNRSAWRERRALGGRKAPEPAIVEMRPASGGFLPAPVHVSAIELRHGRGVATVSLADAGGSAAGAILADGSAWGPPSSDRGEPARPFLSHGSPYRKVAAALDVPDDAAGGALSVAIRCFAEQACAIEIAAFVGDREFLGGPVELPPGRWYVGEAPLAPRAAGLPVAEFGQHGTGAITIDDVWIESAGTRDSLVLRHGEPADVVARYRITDPGLDECAQVLVAVLRDGVADVCRFGTDALRFTARAAAEGVVRLHVPRLPLANGHYTLTIMVARSGYYRRPQTQYFSVNPDVYCCLTQVLEFAVEGGGVVATGTSVVLDGEWSMSAAGDARLAGQ
ncbi:MAG TPA: ABC transporter ATP-binding protein [Vicinamibacterales bacterium]|nr:ABC transporter ATP-binding protein [Vicinamibacterales bacterium]